MEATEDRSAGVLFPSLGLVNNKEPAREKEGCGIDVAAVIIRG